MRNRFAIISPITHTHTFPRAPEFAAALDTVSASAVVGGGDAKFTVAGTPSASHTRSENRATDAMTGTEHRTTTDSLTPGSGWGGAAAAVGARSCPPPLATPDSVQRRTPIRPNRGTPRLEHPATPQRSGDNRGLRPLPRRGKQITQRFTTSSTPASAGHGIHPKKEPRQAAMSSKSATGTKLCVNSAPPLIRRPKTQRTLFGDQQQSPWTAVGTANKAPSSASRTSETSGTAASSSISAGDSQLGRPSALVATPNRSNSKVPQRFQDGNLYNSSEMGVTRRRRRPIVEDEEEGMSREQHELMEDGAQQSDGKSAASATPRSALPVECVAQQDQIRLTQETVPSELGFRDPSAGESSQALSPVPHNNPGSAALPGAALSITTTSVPNEHQTWAQDGTAVPLLHKSPSAVEVTMPPATCSGTNQFCSEEFMSDRPLRGDPHQSAISLEPDAAGSLATNPDIASRSHVPDGAAQASCRPDPAEPQTQLEEEAACRGLQRAIATNKSHRDAPSGTISKQAQSRSSTLQTDHTKKDRIESKSAISGTAPPDRPKQARRGNTTSSRLAVHSAAPDSKRPARDSIISTSDESKSLDRSSCPKHRREDRSVTSRRSSVAGTSSAGIISRPGVNTRDFAAGGLTEHCGTGAVASAAASTLLKKIKKCSLTTSANQGDILTVPTASNSNEAGEATGTRNFRKSRSARLWKAFQDPYYVCRAPEILDYLMMRATKEDDDDQLRRNEERDSDCNDAGMEDSTEQKDEADREQTEDELYESGKAEELEGATVTTENIQAGRPKNGRGATWEVPQRVFFVKNVIEDLDCRQRFGPSVTEYGVHLIKIRNNIGTRADDFDKRFAYCEGRLTMSWSGDYSQLTRHRNLSLSIRSRLFRYSRLDLKRIDVENLSEIPSEELRLQIRKGEVMIFLPNFRPPAISVDYSEIGPMMRTWAEISSKEYESDDGGPSTSETAEHCRQFTAISRMDRWKRIQKEKGLDRRARLKQPTWVIEDLSLDVEGFNDLYHLPTALAEDVLRATKKKAGEKLEQSILCEDFCRWRLAAVMESAKQTRFTVLSEEAENETEEAEDEAAELQPRPPSPVSLPASFADMSECPSLATKDETPKQRFLNTSSFPTTSAAPPSMSAASDHCLPNSNVAGSSSIFEQPLSRTTALKRPRTPIPSSYSPDSGQDTGPATSQLRPPASPLSAALGVPTTGTFRVLASQSRLSSPATKRRRVDSDCRSKAAESEPPVSTLKIDQEAERPIPTACASSCMNVAESAAVMMDGEHPLSSTQTEAAATMKWATPRREPSSFCDNNQAAYIPDHPIAASTSATPQHSILSSTKIRREFFTDSECVEGSPGKNACRGRGRQTSSVGHRRIAGRIAKASHEPAAQKAGASRSSSSLALVNDSQVIVVSAPSTDSRHIQTEMFRHVCPELLGRALWLIVAAGYDRIDAVFLAYVCPTIFWNIAYAREAYAAVIGKCLDGYKVSAGKDSTLNDKAVLERGLSLIQKLTQESNNGFRRSARISSIRRSNVEMSTGAILLLREQEKRYDRELNLPSDGEDGGVSSMRKRQASERTSDEVASTEEPAPPTLLPDLADSTTVKETDQLVEMDESDYDATMMEQTLERLCTYYDRQRCYRKFHPSKVTLCRCRRCTARFAGETPQQYLIPDLEEIQVPLDYESTTKMAKEASENKADPVDKKYDSQLAQYHQKEETIEQGAEMTTCSSSKQSGGKHDEIPASGLSLLSPPPSSKESIATDPTQGLLVAPGPSPTAPSVESVADSAASTAPSDSFTTGERRRAGVSGEESERYATSAGPFYSPSVKAEDASPMQDVLDHNRPKSVSPPASVNRRKAQKKCLYEADSHKRHEPGSMPSISQGRANAIASSTDGIPVSAYGLPFIAETDNLPLRGCVALSSTIAIGGATAHTSPNNSSSGHLHHASNHPGHAVECSLVDELADLSNPNSDFSAVEDSVNAERVARRHSKALLQTVKNLVVMYASQAAGHTEKYQELMKSLNEQIKEAPERIVDDPHAIKGKRSRIPDGEDLEGLRKSYLDDDRFACRSTLRLSLRTRRQFYLKCALENVTAPMVIGHLPNKGRCVFAGATIYKGDFVCEYSGQYYRQFGIAKSKEKEHGLHGKGSYLFFFQHPKTLTTHCIDATFERKEFGIGRLINHSHRHPNLEACVVPDHTVNGQIGKLIFFANRDINVGEEFLIDYGETNHATLEANPWLYS